MRAALARQAVRDPLPLALLALTVVSGMVDAVSFVGLGRVFTANMTGNIVLLVFAAAGAPGLSAGVSLTSLAGFAVGAVTGGRTDAALPTTRHRHRILVALGAETVLRCGATGVAAAVGRPHRPAPECGGDHGVSTTGCGEPKEQWPTGMRSKRCDVDRVGGERTRALERDVRRRSARAQPGDQPHRLPRRRAAARRP